jgi:hypothetical protein
VTFTKESERVTVRWEHNVRVADEESDESWSFIATLEDGWSIVAKFRIDDDREIGYDGFRVCREDGVLQRPNSTVWRRFRLGAIWKAAQRTWPEIRILFPAVWGQLPDQLAGDGPGRRGHPLVHYARWAELYEQAYAEAPRSPVKLLSDREGYNEQTIRAWLAKAQTLGFFKRPRGATGLAGGSLTPKGRRLLEQARANQEAS